MKTKLHIVRSFLTIFMLGIVSFSTFAFEYTISFTASGQSTVFDSIVVKNITKGISITIPRGGILILSDVVSDLIPVTIGRERISVYSSPALDKATLSFYAGNAGNARIGVFGTDGKEILATNTVVQAGNNSFELSLPNGIWIIQARGTGYSYTAKTISQSGTLTVPKIRVIDIPVQKTKLQKSKKTAGTMLFSMGDELLYTGIAGNSTTVMTDSPTGNNSIDFSFVECKDGSGNYYPVVKIGTQLWMARNLNTTKYFNGDNITYLTTADEWRYAYSEGMCNNYNNPDNGLKYGKLYNWYAVSDSRKLAPAGWHVATQDEWTTLKVHVDTHWGAFANVAKALAAHEDWKKSLVEGAVGNNLYTNNYTGFTALPGGDRGGTNGTFFNLGEAAFWWTSTEFNISNAWYWYFDNNALYIVWDNSRKQFGLSVRCVKD
ncbi:MAG: FISUMP domain-containing protein [Paludibacter sp.]|nr:FISUMP domain-containing protein [Paludibacter sp.]